MQTQGIRRNTGSPNGDRRCDQLATRERQAGPHGVTERLVVLMKPSNVGGGKGPQLKGNARSDEGGGIGVEPNNPSKRSEVADGVARQSEGIAQLTLPCFVRQGVSQGRSGIRIRMLQSQRRSGRRRRSEVRGHRDVRSRAVAGRTGARAEKPNLSTTSCAASLYTEAGRETAAARSARYPGSDSGDGSSSGARTNLRDRSTARAVRLSARPQRTGRCKTRP